MSFNARPEISIEEGLDLFNQKMQQALQAVSQKGFSAPQIPQYQTSAGVQYFRGELPADLTTLNDQQLGTYMGLLSEWNAYVQYQLAEASSHLTEAKAQLALTEAKLKIAYKTDEEGKKRSNPERDDYVGSDRRYVECQANQLYWEAIYRYVKAIASNAENAFSAVSRRITQRGQEIERERRNSGVTSNVNIPSGPIFGPQGYNNR